MKYYVTISLIIFFLKGAFAQLPNIKFGQDNTLEIATWNIKQFGNQGKGPDNEEKQMQKILENLRFLNFDIIALQEITNQASFESMVMKSDYQGIRSNEGSKSQNLAILWNPNAVELLENRQILVSEKHTFAQRVPHQFKFRDKTGAIGEEFYVIIIHLKAHIPFASVESNDNSYKRRATSGKLLTEYIDASLNDKKVIVIGDWNDDVDQSNYNYNPTPFQSILDNPNYNFATKHLSWAGASSSVYGSVIDHILISNELFKEQYQTGIAYLKTYDKNYNDDLSDHYPVYIIFK